MKCVEARQALLEADLPTLEGDGEDALALHLRSCPECEARARAILGGESLLASGLSRALPLPELDSIIERALEKGVGTTPLPAPWRRRVYRGPGLALVPLAAAAAMVALFLGRSPTLPGPRFTPPPPHVGLEVEAPEGQSVVVLETSNPDITVLWLF